MELIDEQSRRRAFKSLRCLTFNSFFYQEIKVNALNAEAVIEKHSLYCDESKWLYHLARAEADFAWLIKVGILRREVDGQGITSRVKLTPMGRQIIEECPELPDQQAGLIEYGTYFIQRNFSLR